MLGAPEADDAVTGYARSPSDVVRLIAYGLTTLALLALTRWATDTITGLQRSIVALIDLQSPGAERILTGTAQITVGIVAIAVFVPAFLLKRYRLLGYIVAGNALTAVLFALASGWLHRSGLEQVARRAVHEAGVTSGLLHPRGLGQIAASFIILAPFVSGRWRRAGAALTVAFALVRLMLSPSLPDDLFVAMAVGATSGCLVLLAFGRPDQRPTPGAIRRALTGSGLAVSALGFVPGDGSLTRYVATLDDGSRLLVRVTVPSDRSADLLYRTYRLVRLKDIGDERPFSSLRRIAEHEALVALQARDVGVRTPRLRAIAEVGSESMLLAYDLIDSVDLEHCDAGRVDDGVLDRVWEQLVVLRTHRIAHRNLRLANLRLDAAGDPWVVDFGFSEVAAADDVLDADLAQLLTALTLVVGPARAVDRAVATMGGEVVATALPLVQPGALTTATRDAFRHHHGLLNELRSTVADRCDVKEPEYAQIERINKRTVLTVGSLALATYFLIPQFADIPAIVHQVQDANWAWFPLALAMSVVTYVAAATALAGSVPNRLPTMPTFWAQVATSFTTTLAPAGIGGMALSTRYLQKAGVDSAVAVSSVGLDTVAGFLMHVLLMVLFIVWAGRSAFGSISLPDPVVILYGVAAVALIAGIGLAIPWVRHQIRDKVFPVVRRSLDGIARTVRSPLKLALLLGGSTIVSIGYILALFFSVQAFGGGLSLVQVGAVYLVGAAIAVVAPTPGGLGALEAAVIAGLVAAGLDNGAAVPAVFLFRLATFWIPILPGWIAFHGLERANYV
jgi:uncharacterized protein (TIRG00374 family)